MNRFLLPVLPLIIFSGCAHSPGSGSFFPGQVLRAMRADTGWIRHLDSLSPTALGPGARCIDPVSHTFSYDGRTWLFNQDWGGAHSPPTPSSSSPSMRVSKTSRTRRAAPSFGNPLPRMVSPSSVGMSPTGLSPSVHAARRGSITSAAISRLTGRRRTCGLRPVSGREDGRCQGCASNGHPISGRSPRERVQGRGSMKTACRSLSLAVCFVSCGLFTWTWLNTLITQQTHGQRATDPGGNPGHTDPD